MKERIILCGLIILSGIISVISIVALARGFLSLLEMWFVKLGVNIPLTFIL